ncbi:hypothetical protein V5P93_002469 [Actinokineospora auranticolor]|uniref:Uncharacterized protein n=1 Tax=Actinokineospora auranticolor TaxID=155976 RepID=A0A2S6GMU2_9PSEU|nr:hypothetical protein [Actinokineospora auranticolor]PPK66500.1 hypothetical protein CLV40_110204 [Actinokineospora auranticolor]
MATRLLLEGPDLEELLDRVRNEHGAHARIVSADRLRKGGVAGFFSKQWFEIGVEVPEPGDPTVPKEQVLSVSDLLALADKDDGAVATTRVPEPREGDEPPTGDTPVGGDPFAEFFSAATADDPPPVNGEGRLGAEPLETRGDAPVRRPDPGYDPVAALRARVGAAPQPAVDPADLGGGVAGLEADVASALRARAGMAGLRGRVRQPETGPDRTDTVDTEKGAADVLRAPAAPVALPDPVEAPAPAGAVLPAMFPSVQRPDEGGRMFTAHSVDAPEEEQVEEPVQASASVPAPASVLAPASVQVFAPMPLAPSVEAPVEEVEPERSLVEEVAPVEEPVDDPASWVVDEELIAPRLRSKARHALPDDDDDDPAWPTTDEPPHADTATGRQRRWDTPVPTDLLVALPGKVIVVAGPLEQAAVAAEWICAKLRLGPGAVMAAGPDVVGRGRVLGPEHAADLAEDLRRKPVPSVVAIDAAVEDPEGGRWAGSVAAALGAKHIVAAVDATRKTADLRRHLAALGGVDALAVYGTAASVDPDSVRELGLPILTIDGYPPEGPNRRPGY